ncbi:methyltransferase [Clostridium zeae]|uniref:Methyltransferase n=1 Tax=Clostridium zeae TaxID=2759022 RepID=A0ABQ1E5I9_9CLOT|nr:class I SAM-dependent methyltransferase [Clostridium zeae]GFZ29995.1 methyltransferase [Clostridium zeae]
MANQDILNVEDVFNMLDSKLADQAIQWNSFYSERWAKAPFIVYPDLPDENLKRYFASGVIAPKNVLELGCGEGRNAVYMAKLGSEITAVDLSESAIANARIFAENNNCSVNFICKSIFELDNKEYDFIYDSGCFHHLPPHRRISYVELLRNSLKQGSYFGLTCFAWGEKCADEVTDWEYYEKHRKGVAFTKEKLEQIFCKDFEVVEIKKYNEGIEGTLQGLGFMWTALFKKK